MHDRLLTSDTDFRSKPAPARGAVCLDDDGLVHCEVVANDVVEDGRMGARDASDFDFRTAERSVCQRPREEGSSPHLKPRPHRKLTHAVCN